MKKTGVACGGNDFVFNAFLYLEPVQRYENMVKIGGPCNNNKNQSILDGCLQDDLTACYLGI